MEKETMQSQNESKDRKLAIRQMTHRLLALRDSAPGVRRDLARGLSSHSRHHARPYTYGVEGSNHDHMVVYPLIGALIAKHHKTPHTDDNRVRLGHSMALMVLRTTNALPDPYAESPGAIERRLLKIEDKNVESAARSIDQILSMNTDPAVPVNFHSVAETLAHWGNGTTAQSRWRRARLLEDFYAHNQNPLLKKEKEEANV